jgi:acyl-coenzyme A thioesterase PaaI-like protein
MPAPDGREASFGGPPQDDRYGEARRAHAGCMICGGRDGNPQSQGLSFERHSDGSVSTLCRIGRQCQGYDGILHGGMISTLLDAAMTHCLFAVGVQAVTAEMTVRFVAPVPIDNAFLLTARLVSQKRRMHWLEACLSLNTKLLARASARFIEPRSRCP